MLRRLATGAALLLLAGAPRLVRAQADDESEVGTRPAKASARGGDVDQGADGAHGRRRGKRSRHHGRFFGHVVPEDKLRTEPLGRPSGNIRLQSANNPTDRASVNIYNKDGSYNLDALGELNHVLRCRRTDAEKPMDPQLLTLLSHVYDHFGGKPLVIVSGYRNQRKQTSNHFKGRASDIRIAGVSPKKIEAFAETLDRGGMGIGIYPRSQFVHIDVRSPPSYRWIDYSPPNPNAPEKRPPRGWKRKKLES
jgi:uncharacterized protein YcbK (DUF882 family)